MVMPFFVDTRCFFLQLAFEKTDETSYQTEQTKFMTFFLPLAMITIVNKYKRRIIGKKEVKNEV